MNDTILGIIGLYMMYTWGHFAYMQFKTIYADRTTYGKAVTWIAIVTLTLYKNGKIAKSRQASNPFTFYSEIYKAIKGNFMPWGKIDFGRDGKPTTSLKVNNEIKSVFKKWEKENAIQKYCFYLIMTMFQI